MRLLFVKPKHIGDALLLTPALSAARTACPDATICVVVRAGTEGILAGCTAINEVLTAPAPEKTNRSPATGLDQLRLLMRLRQQRFDYAFELGNTQRGRFLVSLSGARVRAAQALREFPPFWRMGFNHLSDDDPWTLHQVEMDYQLVRGCLPLSESIPPLQFDRNAADFGFVKRHGLRDFTVIHPGTRWRRKQWPKDRWVELVRRLAEWGQHLVFSSGPDVAEVGLCEEIARESKADVALTRGGLSWPQMAGLLYSSSMFIGVDTAAMHLAAACQTPTVALFGPSWEGSWRPWKVPHRLIAPTLKSEPESLYEHITQARERQMEDITCAQVLEAIRQLLLETKNT